jgi:D-alanine-D-alanine ligase
MTKHIVRDLGIPTPDFALVYSEDDIASIKFSFPLFAKPVAEGTGMGISALSKINNRHELVEVCSKLLADFKQPVLVETYLPGREFTVGILGTGKDAKALGAVEVILNPSAEQNAYTYENKEHYEKLVKYVLVNDDEAIHAKEISLMAWRGLDLKDAGRVDLRSDARGIPHFMEVNSLAGLNPVRSDLPIMCNLLGITYHELISAIIYSAIKRANAK